MLAEYLQVVWLNVNYNFEEDTSLPRPFTFLPFFPKAPHPFRVQPYFKGYPWTYQKIESGLLLLEELNKGHGFLYDATIMYVGNKKEKVALQNDQAQKTDQTDQLTNISSSTEDSFISVSSIEDIEKLT